MKYPFDTKLTLAVFLNIPPENPIFIILVFLSTVTENHLFCKTETKLFVMMCAPEFLTPVTYQLN